MKLVKKGFTPWGPQNCTCARCRDEYEIEAADVTFWEESRGSNSHDEYKVTVGGFVCPNCKMKNRIASLTSAVIAGIVRERQKNSQNALYREMMERAAR